MDQQTAKDLINIMKISTSKEFNNKDVLRKIINISRTTDNFSSSLGVSFINRVKNIVLEKEDDLRCIVCKKDKASNGIVCNKCVKLYNEKVHKVKEQKRDITEVSTPKDNVSKKYPKSLLGTMMYRMTAFMRKKSTVDNGKENALHQVSTNGHRFIGIFTILFFLTYIFSLYAGAVVLIGGIVMALCALVKKLSQYKGVSLGYILLSIIIWPIGLFLLVLGIIKKIGYLYKNGKYIGLGFAFYGYVALICAYMHDMPGDHCSPGIVGYLGMIIGNDYGTRWNRNEFSALGEMVLFLVGGLIIVFITIGFLSSYLDEVEEYCCKNGLSVRQGIMKVLQSPIEVLLIFFPLILFILCKIESLEDGWSLDIDNEIHKVSSYKRFRNGKWEDVRESVRRNPDDIVNNNLSYRGQNPYNGSNPIRNNRYK